MNSTIFEAIKKISLFTFLYLSFLFTNTSKTLACSGIPLKGNYALSQNCTLGGTTVGVTGNLDLYTGETGYQLAILDGQTAAYTGSINIGNGYISIANGGSISNQDTYVVDEDGDGWPSAFDTETGSGIYRVTGAGRIPRNSTTSNIADYDDSNASIQTYSYSYAQTWYYTYAQTWYYAYGQAWYYAYGQSNYYRYTQSSYWRYSYGQSTYWRYSYAQGAYAWRKAI